MKEILKKEYLQSNKRKLLLIVVAVMILSITAVGYVLTFNEVVIVDGEEEFTIKTRKDYVREVLEEEEISYIPEDSITPALDTEIEDGMRIVIKRAVNIRIQADGETITLLTPVEDVEAALQQAGLLLEPKDEVTPSLGTKLEEGMTIEVTRALGCSIEVDGGSIQLLTTASNVEEALEEAQVTIGDLDRIDPELHQEIQEGLTIKIVRVKEEIKTEKQEIDFNTKRKNDSSMNRGTTKVVQKGQKGQKELQVKVTYEDGKEVKREVLEERILKEPVDQIIKVGTKAVPVVNRGGGEVKATLRVSATAYSSQDPGVGKYTSTGARVKRGIIAVDPRVIPLGTKIYVPGYGYGVAADTGGSIRGNRIDVAFDTRAEALRFGRKTVTIKIYGK